MTLNSAIPFDVVAARRSLALIGESDWTPQDAMLAAACHEIERLMREKQRWATEGFLGPDDVRRARTQQAEIERLREYYEASQAVERGVIDFDLHADSVERLRLAREQLRFPDGRPEEADEW